VKGAFHLGSSTSGCDRHPVEILKELFREVSDFFGQSIEIAGSKLKHGREFYTLDDG
jgi:hypothetical protein